MKKLNFLVLTLIIVCFISGCSDKTSETTENQVKFQQNDTQKVDYIQKYAPVLNKYKEFVNSAEEIFKNTDKEKEYIEEPWSGIILDLKNNYKDDKTGFGYALKNLNGNGIPQLILLLGNKESYSISAIYSLVKDKPKLLGSYAYVNMCNIDADGNIYNSKKISDDKFYFGIYKIKQDGTDFETIDAIETITEPINEKAEDYIERFYRIKNDGEKAEISEEEAEKIFEKIPKDDKDAKLEFIPLL